MEEMGRRKGKGVLASFEESTPARCERTSSHDWKYRWGEMTGIIECYAKELV